jgi:hypothetical protein
VSSRATARVPLLWSRAGARILSRTIFGEVRSGLQAIRPRKDSRSSGSQTGALSSSSRFVPRSRFGSDQTSGVAPRSRFGLGSGVRCAGAPPRSQSEALRSPSWSAGARIPSRTIFGGIRSGRHCPLRSGLVFQVEGGARERSAPRDHRPRADVRCLAACHRPVGGSPTTSVHLSVRREPLSAIAASIQSPRLVHPGCQLGLGDREHP